MFKRMLLDDWATWTPIISFVLIAGVFVIMTLRALRIKPEDRKHLASLPLDGGETDNKLSTTP
ncbi:MAG: hypothetical protein V4640_09595 [Verrucomicrobiota bacterium]